MADNYQPTLAINFLVTLSGGGSYPGSEATENGDPGTLTMGMLRMVAFGSEQSQYQYADGQILPINQNQALFSLLGTEFGGNGSTNMALPDLRDLVIVGSDSFGGDFAGHFGSAATAALSQTELPASAGGGSTSNMQPSLALSYLIRVSDTDAGMGPTPAGGVVQYAGYYNAPVPNGYLRADGTLLSRAAFPDLFAAIGTTYNLPGDTDPTTFRLPDLVGRNVVGISAEFELGETVGTGGLVGQDQLPVEMGGTGAPLDNRAPGVAMHYIICVNDSIAMLGEIAIIAGDAIPDGWMECDGSILDAGEYEALFDLISSTYGGNGTTDFALPDLRGKTIAQFSTTHPLGTSYGSESSGSAITMADIPALSFAGTSAGDTLYGGDQADSIDGTDGNDSITGNGGNDTLSGGEGNDTLIGGTGYDVLRGGDGNDLLIDTDLASFDGGDGADTIEAGGVSGTLAGGNGDDTFIATGSASLANFTIFGDAGFDTLQLGANDTSYGFSYGHFSIERISLGVSPVGGWTLTPTKSFLDGITGKTLTIDGAVEITTGVTINGSNLDASGYHLVIDSRQWSGNDSIKGSVDSDTIYAGTGVDTVDASNGADTIIFTANGQAGTGDSFDGGSGTDTLKFETDYFNIDASDATFANIETISITGGGRVLFAGSQFGAGKISNSLQLTLDSISQIKIDGAANFSAAGWSIAGFQVQLNINGTTSADTITGSDVSYRDWIDGKGGGDIIHAGAGADRIIVYAGDSIDAGSGSDTIQVDAEDYLVGATIDAGAGDNDVLSITGAEDYDFTTLPHITGIDTIELGYFWANTLTLSDELVAGAMGTGTLVVGFQTAAARTSGLKIDGSQLTAGHSFAFALGDISDKDNTLLGGGGHDELFGGKGRDTVIGGAGDDTINGYKGDDSIEGGSDRDSIVGGEGSDTIYGGEGIDTLEGGEGDDTFIINSLGELNGDEFYGGDGTDTLQVLLDSTSPLRLDNSGAGFWDFEKIVVHQTVAGAELVLSGYQFGAFLISNNLSIGTTANSPYSDFKIHVTDAHNFSAANWTLGSASIRVELEGWTGNDTIVGSEGADTIRGGGGSDDLKGGGGNDSIYFDADDTVDGGEGADRFTYTGNPADLAGTSIEGGLVGGTPEAVTDDILELVQAGTYVLGSNISNVDIVLLSDQSSSNAFNVTLTNGMVSTSSFFGATSRLRVQIEAALSDATIDGSGLTGTNSISVGIQQGLTVRLIASGGEGDDLLSGGQLGDTLTGGGGNDSLYGFDGADSLSGGAGNDTLNGGAGADTFVGGAGDDLIQAGTDSTDIIQYAGSWLDYDIVYDSGTGEYTVTSTGLDAGTDIVTGTFSAFRFMNSGPIDVTASDLINVAPVVGNLSGTSLTESGFGVAGTASATGDLLAGVTDGNVLLGDTTHVSRVRSDTLGGNYTSIGSSGDTAITGKYGVLTLHADGTYTYTLDNSDPDTQAIEAHHDEDEVFTFEVGDHRGLTDTATLTFSVNGSDDAPVFTSASVAFTNEDDSLSFTVTAPDPEGASIVYSIAGPDAQFFEIDETSGVITQVGALDYDDPTDADHDNTYVFTITAAQANDTSVFSTQSFVVRVQNINETPVIVSNGGGTTGSATVHENSSVAATIVVANDPEGSVSYSIAGGADQSRFTIDAATGVLMFASAPNFETPTDADGDNIHEVIVRATDGSLSDTQTLSIGVANVNETPMITSGATYVVSENALAVGTMTATDVDSAISYSIAGADAALFEINAATGVVTFRLAPDYEARADADRDNIYTFSVVASDGFLTDSRAVTVTVTDINGKIIAGNDKANKIDASHGIGGKTATTEEDKIDGKGGDDTIKGGDGNDTLIGGAGKDILAGGNGDDSFVFRAKLGLSNFDTIADFRHDTDILALDDTVFNKLGGKLEKGEFYMKAGATKAHDKDDRIIYDSKTGKLYYDDDGSKKGGHDAVHFATLSTKPAIDHGDFGIV